MNLIDLPDRIESLGGCASDSKSRHAAKGT